MGFKGCKRAYDLEGGLVNDLIGTVSGRIRTTGHAADRRRVTVGRRERGRGTRERGMGSHVTGFDYVRRRRWQWPHSLICSRLSQLSHVAGKIIIEAAQ